VLLEISFLCSQEPGNYHYPEPDQSSPRPSNRLEIHFNISFPFVPKSSVVKIHNVTSRLAVPVCVVVIGLKHTAPLFRLKDALCACEELLATCHTTVRCHRLRKTRITLPTILSRVHRLATDNHFPDCPLKTASTLDPRLCCCNKA